MNSNTLFDQRQNFFLGASARARGGLILCILLGLAAFVGAIATGQGTRAWGSLLFNLFWFFSIAVGGIAFSAMQDVIGARWGRPIMRLHESFASFLPVAALLFSLFFLCIQLHIADAEKVYSWIRDPNFIAGMFGKDVWLQPGFMMLRGLFSLAVILLLAFWQLRLKLTRDLAFVQGDRNKAGQLGIEARDRLRFYSAPVLIGYALAFSCLAFDLTMSLSPKWFSTLWGGWNFAIMMQSLMATLLITMFMVRGSSVGQFIKRQQFHDIGKLMHGFTIFFAYLTYAHVLTYWYGNVPEETEYYIHRLHGPWLVVTIVAPLLVFLLPLFALIPKASKWTAGFAIPIASVILFAQWLVALLVVMPETVEASKFTVPWVEIGLFFGVLGLFLTSVQWFGRRFPMIAVGDPLLAQALAEDH